MDINQIFNVKASVHMEIANNGYRVKVEVQSIGMYINGMVVYPPNVRNQDWSVFTPSVSRKGRNYIHAVEFDSHKPLWQDIRSACIQAVLEYQSDTDLESNQIKQSEQDIVPTEEEVENLDLSNIPF